MGAGIFHIDDDGRLIRLVATPYESEDRLQSLLEEHPELLAGDQMPGEARQRWLLITREMGVPGEEGGCDRWSADHVFVDQDGIPTIVEVKRSTDTRIRREVVGQMLDYAANAVVYWPAERIQSEFERRCSERGDDPATLLGELLDGEKDADDFWRQVQTNLVAGRLRLIFVADFIPPELRSVVEFLNEQMDRTEVLAIEIKHYEGDRGRVLVPRVLGQTAAARNRKGDSPRQKREWDEASFIEDLERRSNRDASDVARHLIEWSRSRFGEPVWGSGAKNGFFSAPLRHDGFRHALFDIGTAGGLYIRFQRLARRGPFEDETLRTDLMHRFNQIPGVHFEKPEGWPEIPIDVLASPSALEQFKKTIEYIADEIQQY